MAFSRTSSNNVAMALYESLSDEGKAEIDRLIEGLEKGASDPEVLDALIIRLEAEWEEHEAGAGFGQAPYAQNNTWSHVRKIRNEIAEDYGTSLADLNASWSKLSTDYGEFLNRDRDEAFGSTPLEAFLMLIREGYYPPPEILLAVADCFEAYFVNHGDIELDRFFKDIKRGLGPFAAQRAAEHDSREFSVMRSINSFRGENLRKNMEDLAVEYLRMKGKDEDDAGKLVERNRRLRAKEKPKN